MINREYKDRLFKFIFQDKEKLLSLYNALNGTEYTNAEELEVTTLEDVIYMKMKNDISFIVDYRLSLYEHQSTLNPNMPLRGFLYFGQHFQKYIEENEYNIYGSTLIKLPTPGFVVFYNGDDMEEDRRILRLSDSFMVEKESGCMELGAMMININYGKNKELMNKCRILLEYSIFVDKVKKYSKNLILESAIDKAVEECIKENILRDTLTKHRAEVKDMLLTEYDEEKTIRLFQNEVEKEKARAEKEKARAEEEKARAEKEKARADAAERELKHLKEYMEKHNI